MIEEAEIETEAAAEVKILGEAIIELPQDLYIPPGALKVFLEAFEGPLDLLLYLIKKQHLDILNIPIVEITRQYVKYVDLMQDMQIELAAEYLVMAAMLAEIKSRLLLPKPPVEGEVEPEDPRAELVRRLQEYERFQQAAVAIDELPRVARDIYVAEVKKPKLNTTVPPPPLVIDDIFKAFETVMKRAKLYSRHQVVQETLSVRERMTTILDKLSNSSFVEFTSLFDVTEGRVGVVVSLIAILELVRQRVLSFVQADKFGPIHVKATTSAGVK